MAKVRDTKSVMLDGTGRRIAEALKGLSMVLAMEDGRILGMNQTDTADGMIVEVIGIPPYISEEELVHYSDYNLTEEGWYAFSRIMAPAGVTVTAETTGEGATGYSATAGEDFVDIAVKFEAADDAIRNLSEEKREYLRKFAYICELGYDIFLKKSIIEHMIDEMALKAMEDGE